MNADDARARFLSLVEGEDGQYGALVDSLHRRGRKDRALAVARRWTEVYEDSAKAWNGLAWAQVDPDTGPPVGNPEDGLRAAGRAVELSGGGKWRFLDTLACAPGPVSACGKRPVDPEFSMRAPS